MKPYKIIEGSSTALEAFEQKIAAALEMGYSLAGELATHPVSSGETKFYQPLILEDDQDFDEDEEAEDEDEEEAA